MRHCCRTLQKARFHPERIEMAATLNNPGMAHAAQGAGEEARGWMITRKRFTADHPEVVLL